MGLGELAGGVFGLAGKGVSGGELDADYRKCRRVVARFLKPDDRLVGARLLFTGSIDQTIPLVEYLARPYYGSRRMAARSATQGHVVNRKRVRRLMRLLGLVAIYPTP